MAAVTPVVEEATGTTPFTIVKIGGMDIIFALESCFKAGKLNPSGFVCITFGFCDLTDHT
jgi:hypothetical protein